MLYIPRSEKHPHPGGDHGRATAVRDNRPSRSSSKASFAWPGMGKLLIDSIHNLDRPVVVAYLLFISLILVFVNFVVDVLYRLLDPRIRLR